MTRFLFSPYGFAGLHSSAAASLNRCWRSEAEFIFDEGLLGVKKSGMHDEIALRG